MATLLLEVYSLQHLSNIDSCDLAVTTIQILRSFIHSPSCMTRQSSLKKIPLVSCQIELCHFLLPRYHYDKACLCGYGVCAEHCMTTLIGRPELDTFYGSLLICRRHLPYRPPWMPIALGLCRLAVQKLLMGMWHDW